MLSSATAICVRHIRFQPALLLEYWLFNKLHVYLSQVTEADCSDKHCNLRQSAPVSQQDASTAHGFKLSQRFHVCVCVCGWKEVSWAVPPSEAWVGDQPLLKMETFLLHSAFYRSILHLCCPQDTRCNRSKWAKKTDRYSGDFFELNTLV